jgi:hypothetical protein
VNGETGSTGLVFLHQAISLFPGLFLFGHLDVAAHYPITNGYSFATILEYVRGHIADTADILVVCIPLPPSLFH